MTDEDHRTVLRGDCALRDRHVVCERDGRVLDNRDRVAVLLQGFIDAHPTGPVHQTAVDENDVLHNYRCIGLCHKIPSRAEHDCHDRQRTVDDSCSDVDCHCVVPHRIILSCICVKTSTQTLPSAWLGVEPLPNI